MAALDALYKVALIRNSQIELVDGEQKSHKHIHRKVDRRTPKFDRSLEEYPRTNAAQVVRKPAVVRREVPSKTLHQDST